MPNRPVPTHLKILRGNPGQRAIRPEPEPEIPPNIPEPPPHLVGYAADEWWRIVTELYRLKLVTAVDINPLAAYCDAYCRWRTAVETLTRMSDNDRITHGLLVKSGNGTAIPNPLVAIADKAANAMVRYAAEFGLTPAARSRIVAGVDDAAPRKFQGLLAS